MINLAEATLEDRLIVAESQTFRNRVRQSLNQAALNISTEGVTDDLSRRRVDLARRMLTNIGGWTDTMTPSIVAVLADTTDQAIMNAIGGVWNAYIQA